VPQKYRLAFLFLALHGKRVGETTSLEWENIDWKKRACRLYQSKILTEQWLPFHELFWKELPRAIHMKGRVFPQLSDNYYNRLLKDYCVKAGVSVVTTHEFSRHSFIAQRQALGVSNELIAMATDNLSSIDHYSHIDLETMRTVINK
jgi:integrase